VNTKDIYSAVKGVIEKYTALEGAVINAAFSGGADSTCLLCILNEFVKEFNFTLRALHVNYNLRGDESIRDRAFCKAFCEKNGIEFHTLEVDGKNLPDCSENALRDIRYTWFETFDGFILTAHTADDNAETFLLNLIRGAGVSGLTGIPENRGRIIRPLLSFEKNHLVNMLDGLGETYITDSSNLSDDYTRNRIRNRIIPEIREINPSFSSAINRAMTVLNAQNRYMENLADDDKTLRDTDEILRPLKLHKFFTHNNLSPDYNKISIIEKAIIKEKRLKLSVGDGKFIVYSPENGEVRLSYKKSYEDKEIAIEPGKSVHFCDKRISISLRNSENFSKNEIVNIKLTQNALDYDIINGIIFAGLRKNGDIYRRVNRNFDSKLKKLYTEFLTEEERDNNIVLRDNDGIIWCEHFGCDERLKITDKTENIMIIEIETV
jgi:tRNA(Ile)-lysidine synthase